MDGQIDSAYRVAWDLMAKISQQEAAGDDDDGGRRDRAYWLKLYEDCRRVVVGGEDAPTRKDR